jgi:phenylpyruvate tautomerase PptA (4-oxalocrotonate tautomerase family)
MRRFMLSPLICSSVPYLQFDVRGTYGAETKRRLAERTGRVYAEVMQTTSSIVKVAFRELGADNLFRCTEDGAPESVVVLMCDIRRGRPAEQRAHLGAVLTALTAQELQVSPEAVEIEFTQHPGDEMYRHGALVADWEPTEADG